MYTIEKVEEVVVKKVVSTKATLAEYVGYQIAEKRKAYGYTVQELLDKMSNQISISYLKNIEKGLDTFKLKDMELICKTLGIEVASLFPQSKQDVPTIL